MFSRAAFSAGRSAVRQFSTSASNSAPRLTKAAVGAAGAGLALGAAFTSPVLLQGPKTIAGEAGTDTERAFYLCKPDAVSRQMVHKMIQAFEERGYKLVAIKSVVPSKQLAEEHYKDLSKKPFFASLVKYITCGVPVIAMVFEGKDVIKQGRRILGATNPSESDPGSLRGKYCVSIGRNAFHGSDSHESATAEIGLWFSPSELATYETAQWPWVMADN